MHCRWHRHAQSQITRCPQVAVATIDTCPREFPDCAEAILPISQAFHCEFTMVNGLTIDRDSFTIGDLSPSPGKGLKALNGSLVEASPSLIEAWSSLDQSSTRDRSEDLEHITALAESLTASTSARSTLTCLHLAEWT